MLSARRRIRFIFSIPRNVYIERKEGGRVYAGKRCCNKTKRRDDEGYIAEVPLGSVSSDYLFRACTLSLSLSPSFSEVELRNLPDACKKRLNTRTKEKE